MKLFQVYLIFKFEFTGSSTTSQIEYEGEGFRHYRRAKDGQGSHLLNHQPGIFVSNRLCFCASTIMKYSWVLDASRDFCRIRIGKNMGGSVALWVEGEKFIFILSFFATLFLTID